MSLLAFLGGMGAGYMSQTQRNRDNEREDKRDAMYAEKFGWERDKAAQEKTDRESQNEISREVEKGARIGTVIPDYSTEHIGADGKTVAVAQPSAGDAEFTAFMQNEAKPEGATEYPKTEVAQNQSYIGKDGLKKVFTGINAAKEAGEYAKANPVSEYERMNAIAKQVGGMRGGYEKSLQLKADAGALETAELARAKRAKEMAEEGGVEAMRFARMGDASGMAEAFGKVGLLTFNETPTLTLRRRDIPGLGMQDTYDVKGTIKNKDGTVKPFAGNTHELSMALFGYDKQISTQAALKTSANKSEYDANLLKIRQEGLANQIALQQLRNEGRGNSSNATTYGAKDIRDMQSDYFTLNSPKQTDVAEKPEVFAARQAAFNKDQIDALGLFRMNGERGNVLHAAELREAQNIMAAAKTNPALIQHSTDVKTNTVSHFVNVGGRSVLVGRSQAKTPAGK